MTEHALVPYDPDYGDDQDGPGLSEIGILPPPKPYLGKVISDMMAECAALGPCTPNVPCHGCMQLARLAGHMNVEIDYDKVASARNTQQCAPIGRPTGQDYYKRCDWCLGYFGQTTDCGGCICQDIPWSIPLYEAGFIPAAWHPVPPGEGRKPQEGDWVRVLDASDCLQSLQEDFAGALGQVEPKFIHGITDSMDVLVVRVGPPFEDYTQVFTPEQVRVEYSPHQDLKPKVSK